MTVYFSPSLNTPETPDSNTKPGSDLYKYQLLDWSSFSQVEQYITVIYVAYFDSITVTKLPDC